jgi:hypothetical protein
MMMMVVVVVVVVLEGHEGMDGGVTSTGGRLCMRCCWWIDGSMPGHVG